MTTIRIAHGTRHQYTADAEGAVTVCRVTRARISDATAATIASWWQSPGSVGRHLAALASGCEVDSEDVLSDIDRTVISERLSEFDVTALELLREWAEWQGQQF